MWVLLEYQLNLLLHECKAHFTAVTMPRELCSNVENSVIYFSKRNIGMACVTTATNVYANLPRNNKQKAWVGNYSLYVKRQKYIKNNPQCYSYSLAL